MGRKVLISQGYGAGWSSWCSEKPREVAEYQPIIDYVESGAPLLSGAPRPFIATEDWDTTSYDEKEAWLHPDFRALVKQMMEDLNLDYFFTGGADGLAVVVVEGSYRIDDYDGSESVTAADDLWS